MWDLTQPFGGVRRDERRGSGLIDDRSGVHFVKEWMLQNGDGLFVSDATRERETVTYGEEKYKIGGPTWLVQI
jgi:hypothetical protein